MSDNTPRSKTGIPDEQVNKAVSGDHFTPGPWKVDRIETGFSDLEKFAYSVVNTKGELVDFVAFKSNNQKMLAANAHLMAAAPEMLAELRKLVEGFEHLVQTLPGQLPQAKWKISNDFIQSRLAEIRNVIQKATTITE